MIKVTPYLKGRFARDCKVPIKIFIEPYFSARLELMDEMFQTKEKYDRFLTSLSHYENEQAYMADYNRVKNEAMAYITERPEYTSFLNMPSDAFAASPTVSVTKKNIYKNTLVGHKLVSIDMKQANFHVLLYFDSDMFGGARTWEDFIRKFTDNEHIIHSKYVREVILGNCAVKRQVALESMLTCSLFNSICGLSEAEPVSLSNDEIVFDITNCKDQASVIRNISRGCTEWIETEGEWIIQLRVEPFTLWKVQGTDGYIRNIENEDTNVRNLDIKCATSKMMPFIIRALNNEPVKPDEDAVFVDDNGLLAMYVQMPEIKILKEMMDGNNINEDTKYEKN